MWPYWAKQQNQKVVGGFFVEWEFIMNNHKEHGYLIEQKIQWFSNDFSREIHAF